MLPCYEQDVKVRKIQACRGFWPKIEKVVPLAMAATGKPQVISFLHSYSVPHSLVGSHALFHMREVDAGAFTGF